MRIVNLVSLIKRSLRLFNDHIDENKIKPHMSVYIREFFTKLEVSEQTRRSSRSSEILHKEDWGMIIYDFVEKEIKSLPEFKDFVQSMVKRYGKSVSKDRQIVNVTGQCIFWLETFIRRMIHEEIDGKLTEEAIIEWSSLFKSEMDQSPIETKFTHYLDGIFLEPESIRLDENALLRKPKKEDLEYTRFILLDFMRPKYLDETPSSILEVTGFTKTNESNPRINGLLNAFRLYALGSVYSLGSVVTRKTAIWPGGSSRRFHGGNYRVSRRYTVKKSEVDKFIKFVNVIEDKLSLNEKLESGRSLSLSLGRYSSALIEDIDIERQLMTAVMGLESLFTLSRDRGENAYKLGVRIAKLLGFLGFDETVRTTVEEAYGLRNKVVHGLQITSKERNKIVQVLPEIMDYLRRSLIFFLLNNEVRKNTTIVLIDKALVSKVFEEQLKVLHENIQFDN